MKKSEFLNLVEAIFFTCLALVTAMIVTPRIAQAGAPPSIENMDQTMSTALYWTADRLAGAMPVPMPAMSGTPQALSPSEAQSAVSSPSALSSPGQPPSLVGKADVAMQLFSPLKQQSISADDQVPLSFGDDPGFRFTSSRLEGKYDAYPNTLEGQLFFTIPRGTTVAPGNYVCSATVQRSKIITTAGHCVSDGNGNFYRNWLFVPAIRDGFAPFGTFTYTFVVTTSTWFTGGGGVPNAQDVAVIGLAPNSAGNPVSAYTGTAGFDIPDLYVGQQVTVLGYPCNLDSCTKAHRTDAQVQNAGGNNTLEIGSDARGGASGGAWMINWGTYAVGEPPPGAIDTKSKAIVAVTSYGPISKSQFYLGASILDSGYVECTPLKTCNRSPSAILNYACFKHTNAC